MYENLVKVLWVGADCLTNLVTRVENIHKMAARSVLCMSDHLPKSTSLCKYGVSS